MLWIPVSFWVFQAGSDVSVMFAMDDASWITGDTIAIEHPDKTPVLCIRVGGVWNRNSQGQLIHDSANTYTVVLASSSRATKIIEYTGTKLDELQFVVSLGKNTWLPTINWDAKIR